jgi:hypothetical protein
VEQIPTYVRGKYFYAVQDRLAELVKAAKEKLEELCDTSTLDISLELTSDYDVGDIIGAYDEITGQLIPKEILRKVIKIKKDILSVDYEVE